MAKERSFTAVAKDGHLPRSVREAIVGLLRILDGQKVVVSIKPWEKPRSVSQNSFYWDAVLPVIIEMHRDGGEIIDKDQAHAFTQREILKRKRDFVDINGTLQQGYVSSKEKSAKKWEEDNESVRAWAAERGYAIKRPNEELEMRY